MEEELEEDGNSLDSKGPQSEYAPRADEVQQLRGEFRVALTEIMSQLHDTLMPIAEQVQKHNAILSTFQSGNGNGKTPKMPPIQQENIEPHMPAQETALPTGGGFAGIGDPSGGKIGLLSQFGDFARSLPELISLVRALSGGGSPPPPAPQNGLMMAQEGLSAFQDILSTLFGVVDKIDDRANKRALESFKYFNKGFNRLGKNEEEE